MKEILLANVGVLALVFAVGYGLAAYLTPNKLQKYTFWLAPWFAIVTIGFMTVMTSLAGLPGKYVAPVLTILLLSLSVMAFLRRPRYHIVPWRDSILAAVITLSIFVNQSPLIKSQKLLTLVSLGNNDALVYASVPDFLRDNTLLDRLVLDRREGEYDYVGIQNLVQNPYRWGTPAIISYFLTMTGLDGYQLAYTFQVILFGLAIPLSYIFFVVIFGSESMVGLLLTTGLVALNAHTLYMLYHNFAGQVLFWGIELFFLIHTFVYFSSSKFTPKLQTADLVLGTTLATLFFSYHEGATFLIVPLAVFLGITIIKRNKDLLVGYWQSLVKIGLVTFTFASVSVIHGLLFDYEQSQLILGPIGWQVFRDKIPFANPFEMTGLWSIHSFPPLPTILAIFLSSATVIVFVYGIRRSRYPRLLFSYVLIYLLLALWVVVINPNFFAYNRVITYVLPVLTPILVGGFKYASRRYVRIQICLTLIALGMAAYSGAKLNLQFMHNNLAVDRSLISLKELANNSEVGETIYSEDIFTKNSILWQNIWTNYFLYPQKKLISNYNFQIPSTGVSEDALVLVSKGPWHSYNNLLLQRVVWENGFYRLGTICASDSCLMSRDEVLSQVTFGEGKYEDTLLINGWGLTEGNHRWANEQTAQVRLVSGSAAPHTLTFSVLSLQSPQQVTVAVDGVSVKTFEVSPTFQTYIVPISPQAHHLYHITFTFTHGYVPGGGDLRTLYGNFSSIALD